MSFQKDVHTSHSSGVIQAATPVMSQYYSEHKNLTESSYKNYGTEGAAQRHGDVPEGTKTYCTRFWILITFSLLAFIHDIEWIIWGPISETMEATFSGWDSATVALMVNWGTILYVIFFIPICWGVQRFGLRTAVLTSLTVLTTGTILRCITSTTPVFTIMCHLCGMTVGLSSPVMLSAPTLIASDWFPLQERTTAMAFMVGSHQFGGVFSYLEPLIVRQPGRGVTKADMQEDVMRLVYIAAGMAGAMLVVVALYFPSKPPSPPSLTSSEERFNFSPALKALLKNKKFILLLTCYGVFAGPSIMWLTVIDFSLLPLGIHQNEAMWIGLIGVVVSSLAPLGSGRLNDLLKGHTKAMLLVLMTLTAAFLYWFLLLSYHVLSVTDWQIYLSTMCALACSYGTVPLFLELAMDIVYPVPEMLVTGVMIAADNLVGVAFLLLYNIPDEYHQWVTYTLTLCTSLTIVPLVAVTFPSTRADIDKR